MVLLYFRRVTSGASGGGLLAMYQFVLRRLLLSLPTLLIVSFLIFGMIRLDPDSVVAARLGEGYTEEQACSTN